MKTNILETDRRQDVTELATNYRALQDPIEEATTNLAALTDRMAAFNDCMEEFEATGESLAVSRKQRQSSNRIKQTHAAD